MLTPAVSAPPLPVDVPFLPLPSSAPIPLAEQRSGEPDWFEAEEPDLLEERESASLTAVSLPDGSLPIGLTEEEAALLLSLRTAEAAPSGSDDRDDEPLSV